MQGKRVVFIGDIGTAALALFRLRLSSQTTLVLLGMLLVWASIPLDLRGQGFRGPFGLGSAETVVIEFRLPAVLYLDHKPVTVQVLSAVPTQAELLPVLRTKLITMIQRDPRFIVEDKKPETILRVTVTSSRIEQRNHSVGAGPGARSCTSFDGRLEVSFEAIDASTKAPLDSDTLVSAISADTRSGGGLSDGLRVGKSPCGFHPNNNVNETQDALIDGIVTEIRQRAAPADEVITVKLPGRKLYSLSRLALAQRWGTLEDEAYTMEKLPNPEDDAYRIYLIALAKEAQAYGIARELAEKDFGKRPDIGPEQADADFKKAQHLLDDAIKLYKDAMQAKPMEKEFQEPVVRVEHALAVYTTIARQKESLTDRKRAPESDPKPADSSRSVASASSSAKTGGSPSPLNRIVGFCQVGLSLDYITDYINDSQFLSDARASSYAFNFGTDSLKLMESCKDEARPIQRAILARLAAQSALPGAPGAQFPWPPPTATTREVLPDHLYRQLPQPHSLEGIDRLLLAALESRGYTERSHYSVPNGFALVTRLERIDADGTPMQAPDRWSIGKVPLRSVSISEWARALFNARPGFYRVIVFIVTDVPFPESPQKVEAKEAKKWLNEGLNVLPEEIGQAPFSPRTVCTALIYEFKRELNRDPLFVDGSVPDARTQLKKSGIWSALQLP